MVPKNSYFLKKRTLGQICYLTALAVYVFSGVIGMSMYSSDLPSRFSEYTSLFAIGLVIISMITSHIRWSQYGVSSIVLLISLLSTWQSGSLLPLMAGVFIIGAQNVSFKDIALVAIITVALTMTFVFGSVIFSRIPNHLFGEGTRERFALGFRYPLFPSTFYLYGVLILTWLTRARIRPAFLFLLAGGTIAFYLATDSRIAAAVTLAALSLSLIPTRWRLALPKRPALITTAATAFFPAIAAIGIGIMITGTMNNPFLDSVNRFFGQRIVNAHSSYVHNGITWFGQPISASGNALAADGGMGGGQSMFIDNSFANTLVGYGIIPTVILLIGLVSLMWRLSRDSDRLTIIILVLVGIHCSIDCWLLLIDANVFLLLIGTKLMGGQQRNGCNKCSDSRVTSFL